MNEIELKDVLDKHWKWLRDEEGGTRADLTGADLRSAVLRGADLRGAVLRGADLRGAVLRGAVLRGAVLRGAVLRGADLRSAVLTGADLRSADLREIKKDFMERLTIAKNEAAGLYDYLVRGKVDGSSYTGECACFVGTISDIVKEEYQHLSNGLKPDSSSPTEIFFFGIRKGDTPSNNQFSAIVVDWVKEFAAEHSILLPDYKLISSTEFPEAFK